MTQKEATQILVLISNNFPYYYKGMSKEGKEVVISTWTRTFSDVPAVLVFEALQRAIPKSTYPPTIAHIQEELNKMYWTFTCLENDMKLNQEERQEAARVSQLLYDLGFAEQGGRAHRHSKEFLKLGGLTSENFNQIES